MTIKDHRLGNVFEKFSQDYQANMMRFRPCKPGGEVLEANLVFSFIMTFKELYPNAFWAVEIPFENTSTRCHSNHLDALIYIDGTLYLIEAKRDYATKDQLDLMHKDLRRIESVELASAIRDMWDRPIYDNPLGEVKEVIGVLLADTWQNSNRTAWQTGSHKGHVQDWLPNHRAENDLGIYAQGSKTPYTLLFAHTDNLLQSLDIIRSNKSEQ